MKLQVIFVLLGALIAPPARAFNFFELEVYPATTEGQGLHEIESQSSFVASGRDREGHRGVEAEEDEGRRHHLFRSSLEYNYGLTDMIDVALYVDFQKPNAEDVEYAAFRARARGSLWERGRFPLDLGWYVEAEVPNEGETDLELEFRPIISRDIGRFTIDVDPIFDLPTVSEERRTLEFAYATRLGYRLTQHFEPSVEFYGSLGQIRAIDGSQESEHYIFPVANFHFGGLKFQVGPGFGITRASDSVIVKFNLEYEFAIP
jgi:hypothetical protein